MEIIEIETLNGIKKHVIIDRGNGEFSSMPLENWEKLQDEIKKGIK